MIAVQVIYCPAYLLNTNIPFMLKFKPRTVSYFLLPVPYNNKDIYIPSWVYTDFNEEKHFNKSYKSYFKYIKDLEVKALLRFIGSEVEINKYKSNTKQIEAGMIGCSLYIGTSDKFIHYT